MEKFKEILLLLGQGLVAIFKIAIKIFMFLGEISSNSSSNSSKKSDTKNTRKENNNKQERAMVATVVQKGIFIQVYNKKGQTLFSQNGELQGFTSNSVSVKRGNAVYVYNEKGQQINVIPCR